VLFGSGSRYKGYLNISVLLLPLPVFELMFKLVFVLVNRLRTCGELCASQGTTEPALKAKQNMKMFIER